MKPRLVEVDLAHESRVGLVQLCEPPESFFGTPHEDGFGRGPVPSGRRKDRTAKTTGHHVPTSNARVLLAVLFRARFVLIGSLGPNVKGRTRLMKYLFLYVVAPQRGFHPPAALANNRS